MSRPLRIAFENAAYHVMARGNRREPIFFADWDRRKFLAKLDTALNKYKAILFAYCLMPNHYHLFLRTSRPNISSFIHDLNSSYANWLKAKYKLVGVVFQGRFKSLIVDEDAYATILSAYIHLNPWRRKIIENPEEYLWSSYQDFLSLHRNTIKRLDPKFVLGRFNRDENVSRLQYRAFLEERRNMKDPLAKFKRSVAAGSDAFRASITLKTRPVNDREIRVTPGPEKPALGLDQISEAMAEVFGIPLAQIRRPKQSNHFRPMGIYLMKKHCPIELKAVGAYWKMDYAAASIAAKRFEEKIADDPKTAAAIYRIETMIEKL
jgi:putative transposase